MRSESSFQPVKREPVYVKVACAIEAEIVAGRFANGDLLPTETELAEQFEVTRSSIREGLRALEQSGLIARGAAKRLIVSRPDAGSVAKAASRSLVLSGATFGEVWEALATFYPEIASLAAVKFNDEDVAALREAHEQFCAIEEGELDAIVDHAAGFLHVLAERLDNQVILALLDSLNRMIAASLALVIDETPKATERIKTAQNALIEAIAERDGDAAATWISKHIDDLKRGFSVAGQSLEARITL
jgi:DNA-binding FadR family transcriptional regulator